MRKFILISTMLLVSTSVHADTSRGLVMASAETTVQSQNSDRSPKKLTVSEQLDAIGETRPAKTQTPPQVAATGVANPQKSAEDAKPVVQPKPAGQTAAAKSDDTRSAAASPRRSERPRVARTHDRDWTEGRVRNELARYGIYY